MKFVIVLTRDVLVVLVLIATVARQMKGWISGFLLILGIF